MKIETKEVREITKILDELIEEYKAHTPETKRDWRTYEQRVAERIKTAMRELEPLIDKAIATIKIVNGESRGRKPELTLKQKTSLLLLKRLFERSNREMSIMLVLFSLLSEIDVSYKTVERLYSDDHVLMVLHNMHTLILKKKGVKDPDTSGDGTGYSLSIKTHYASAAQKLKDKVKKKSKKSQFIYSFKLLDLDSRMYVASGISFKSEQEAFLNAIEMARETGVNSIRLDRYYSRQKYVKILENELGSKLKVYLIPKKNATIRGSWKWKRMLNQFVHHTKEFLKEYFQRNQSESGFSEDKRRFGWKIPQKIEERIQTADFTTLIWHNLFWLKN